MDKLVEREPASEGRALPAAPALAVQFFLIPLAVVGLLVAIYAGFRMLVTEERTAEDYLHDIQSGGRERRWPAAFELSRLVADPDVQRRHPHLGPTVRDAFERSKGDDPRLRRYLALTLGRISPPTAGAREALEAALEDPDSEVRISAIWALGALGDPAAVPAVQRAYGSEDEGVRKVAVFALGALPGDAQLATLRLALEDRAADVRWNAAVALARHHDAGAVPVLRQMLDRRYVADNVKRTADPAADTGPVDEVLVSGAQAAAMLGAAELRAPLEALSREDENARVRQAAARALQEVDSKANGV
jgi:hypothetical protein